MKLAINFARVVVGLLFIFSGLIKANDPLGLSYKMQEFFELWGMTWLNSHSLFLSVVMNAFEIIAGFALLLGWRIKLFSWLLLLLILFFTFLTGYAYLSGKFQNCGCFGDCIPISAKTSFLKDIVLAVLIGLVFWQRKRIKPLFSNRTNTLLMALVTIISFGIQWYTLTYLPVWDCLPFKKGNNINEQLKRPANAIPDSTVITYVYEKDGKKIEFTADKFPEDFNTPPYTFKSRYDKVIRKGKNIDPPIKGFVLSGASNVDSTQVVLSQPYAILVFNENYSVPVSKWKKDFEELYAMTKAKNIPAWFITGNVNETAKHLQGTSFADIPVFKLDFTAIRTAARTSPELYLLKNGTIINKWSYKNIDDARLTLKEIPMQPPINTQ